MSDQRRDGAGVGIVLHPGEKLIAFIVDGLGVRRRGVVRSLQDWAKAENLDLVSVGPSGLPAGSEDKPRMVVLSIGAQSVTDPEIGTIVRNLASLVSDVPLAIPGDRDSRRPQDPSIKAGDLTSRQRDVASLLSRGLCNKLIARQLAITEATVKVHIRQIMRKLGASNRTQAALLTARVLAAAEPEKSDADAKRVDKPKTMTTFEKTLRVAAFAERNAAVIGHNSDRPPRTAK
jgi:DNA-binding CsgD family transcriptional regulator